MEKVALYVRGYNKKAVDEKLKKLRDFCKDVEIYREFIDTYPDTYMNKNAIRKVRIWAQKGKFTKLYLYDFEDISRKLSTVIETLKKWKKYGVEVYSIGEEETGSEFIKGLELVFGTA